MSVVAVFFCFASGKDAVADLPADVMEGTRNLKSVGLHGSIGLPEPQVNERIRGQIRSTIVLYSDEQKKSCYNRGNHSLQDKNT